MKKYLITILITAIIVAAGVSLLYARNASLSTQDIKNNPAEATAFVYISQNSEIDFKLKELFRGVNFAAYDVIPTDSNADKARIILKNNGTSWEVIGFGTAFPGLEDAYPELKGKI